MNGIIIVDKPGGMTSFSVVSRIRRIVGERHVGHAGTLDPMATGVLPVFIGSATRAVSLLPCQDKIYRARFKLGITTDTGDITGKTLSVTPVSVVQQDVVRAARAFKGEIFQTPPMYSAIRMNGKHLYELAREGFQVERQPRKITINDIEILSAVSESEYSMRVSCSKGTYIRTLCEDIGKSLGCGAVMTFLRRTFAAGFSIESAFTLEQVFEFADAGRLSECILDVEYPFIKLPEIFITDKQTIRFSNGGALSLDRLDNPPDNGLCRVKAREGRFLGLGSIEPEKQECRVQCLFTSGDN